MTRDTGQAVLLRLRRGQTQTSARLSQAPQGRGGWGADPPAETWRRHGHGGHGVLWVVPAPPNPPQVRTAAGHGAFTQPPPCPTAARSCPHEGAALCRFSSAHWPTSASGLQDKPPLFLLTVHRTSDGSHACGLCQHLESSLG